MRFHNRALSNRGLKNRAPGCAVFQPLLERGTAIRITHDARNFDRVLARGWRVARRFM